MNRLHLFPWLIGLTIALAGACAQGGGVPFDRDDPRIQNAQLVFAGPEAFTLRFGGEADLRVRYQLEDGTPISTAPIDFEIEGGGGGSSLTARSAQTGGDGVASVGLSAGDTNAAFQVKATPPEGDPLLFNIAVTDETTGSITVEMAYSGSQSFDTFRPYLFRGESCETLDPFALPTAERIAMPASRLAERPTFPGLDPADDYTVAIVAEIAGDVAGFGCSVGVSVTARENTLVKVSIVDRELPVRFDGVYDLSNRLDFGGALPPSVDSALNILDELTDDEDIEGNASTEDWGQDPGAFVTDIVMRQTCHWECRSGEDYDSCSEINHRLGDLEKLYTEDFTGWDGAEERFSFGCAAWEFAARTAQQFVNNAIGTYVPEIVRRFLDAAGDLSRAIIDSRIESVMTLTPTDSIATLDMEHELVTMEVKLTDLGGEEHISTIRLADVGLESVRTTGTATAVSNELMIPSHTFALDLGKLIQYIYLNELLPLFGFSSTAEMLMSWIDCDEVAAALHDAYDGLSLSRYRSACTAGVEAAGDFVDDNIDGTIDGAATFTLEGRALGTDLSTDGIAQTLEEGIWWGMWGDGGMSDEINGTFEGRRRL